MITTWVWLEPLNNLLFGSYDVKGLGPKSCCRDVSYFAAARWSLGKTVDKRSFLGIQGKSPIGEMKMQ